MRTGLGGLVWLKGGVYITFFYCKQKYNIVLFILINQEVFFMKKFRMSAEIARVLFEAKDGVLFWADNGAVNEAVRGRRVGATSSNFEQTSYLGNRYDTADLLHLVERGEWPAYEDTKKGLQAKVQKKNTVKRDSRTYSREMQDVIAERLSVIESMLRG
jgi:hypothetical protein